MEEIQALQLFDGTLAVLDAETTPKGLNCSYRYKAKGDSYVAIFVEVFGSADEAKADILAAKFVEAHSTKDAPAIDVSGLARADVAVEGYGSTDRRTMGTVGNLGVSIHLDGKTRPLEDGRNVWPLAVAKLP